MMKKIIKNIRIATVLLISLFYGVETVYAQKNQIRKAEKIYDTYSYIDAQEVYLKVVDKGYKSPELYKKLGDTYYFNGDYENASNWYSLLLKEYPEAMEGNYTLRTIQSFKSVGEYEKANNLSKDYSEKNPESIIVKNYQENPNYLEEIIKRSGKHTISKTTINTSFSDFSPSFYGNEKVVFASGNTGNKKHAWNNQPFFNLFEATVDSLGKLTGKTELKGDVKSNLNESSTAFTADGKTMYFTRNNKLKGKSARQQVMRHKLYKATNEGGQWNNIVELPFNDDNYSVAHPALSPDGKRLYFSSDMPGTLGQSDLWFVEITGNDNEEYTAPVNLSSKINTEGRETFPFIAKDNVLYFATDGRAGLGGLDIYSIELGEDGLPKGEIQTFGEPVNSPQDDFGFIIDRERNLIYLTSNRSEGKEIVDNIYFLSEACEVLIKGTITDAYTNEPLPGAKVVLLNKKMNEVQQTIVGQDGKYNFSVNCEEEYTVRGSKEEYLPKEEVVVTPDISSEIDVSLALEYAKPCHPADLGCRLTLQPIYFDFDKHNIRTDAEVELAKILAAMEQYPELKIHIESHTDSRGNDAYNEALSERRAQSTQAWLISKGINSSRLTAKGYGERRLINECANNVPCSEEKHQLNRRSMFIIVE